MLTTNVNATVTYTDFNLQPIKRLWLYYNGGGGTIYISNFYDGSNYSLNAITRTNDLGIERTVGYKFNGQFKLLQNDFDTINNYLHIFSTYSLTNFIVELFHETKRTYLYIGGSTIEDCGSFWNIEQSGDTPILTLNLTAFIDINSFNVAESYEVFQQNW